MGIGGKQRLGGEDHAGNTEAALYGAQLGEFFGELRKARGFAITLNGHDLMTVHRAHRDTAGVGQHAVDQHRARAALALLAAAFDAFHIVIVTQDVEQSVCCRARVGDVFCIESETNVVHHDTSLFSSRITSSVENGMRLSGCNPAPPSACSTASIYAGGGATSGSSPAPFAP